MTSQVYHFTGLELIYSRPHRFQVRLWTFAGSHFADFSSNGETHQIQITRAQYEAFQKRAPQMAA